MLHNVHGKSNSLRTHHWWALYIRNSTVPILSLLHSSNLIHVWIPFLNWDKSHWASHMVTKQLNDEEILIWSLWIRHAREPQVSVNCEFLHAPSNCLTQNSKSVPCENRPPPTMTELMHLQKQTTCSLLRLHGDCYLWRQLTGKMQSRPWKVKGQPRANLGQFLCLGPFTANKCHTLIPLHNQRKPLTCSPVEKAEWKIRPFPQPRQLPRGTWALILQHVTTGDGHGHGHRGLPSSLVPMATSRAWVRGSWRNRWRRSSQAGFLPSGRDKEAADKLLKDLDASGDATVDINEFTLFVAVIASACHMYLEHEALNGCPIHPDSWRGRREQAPSFQKALGSNYVSGHRELRAVWLTKCSWDEKKEKKSGIYVRVKTYRAL